MKTILISGASGFVGQSLVEFFSKQNYNVIQIKRDILNNSLKLDELINSSDIVINLSGANIINRWSKSYKELLVSSRINTTKSLVNSIKRVEKKPKLFISTSAVGIYDNKAKYDENGSFSNDFLSTLCQDWEEEAQKAKSENTKVAIFRFGIVLGKDGGAFKKMITPFKLGLGGVIGSGKQHFSYIHIEDLIEVYKFVIENNFDGVFNCTAPTPTTNYEFTKALGEVLNRPTIFSIPEFVLKLIFSEGAKVLSDGQSAVPKKLLDLGFNFKYKNIELTLKSLIK
ncbi:TIGR01777 family oxidoreductase [Arcobacter porcinus]|uniref:Epimerase family protein n=1 Tax=Arcobacter porcinus TaxID=1935204 RepID=A0ABX2YDW6_9BACT|nr:TIGR01777 family oxidoreductase [Arcobacter porcinus]OCL82873.1 Epimerase family protein [Arcobacter porcinus]OCL86572.1 Epimerase family protein [Arcobacter porcinus]OCL93092.1 Epimerase family protein [Arcobacter porcinus]